MLLDVAFDLDFSLCCGQVFRWKKLDGWWYGVVGDRVLKIRQCGKDLEFEGVDEAFVRYYFGLDDDLDAISREVNKDPYIAAALSRFAGLRLVRQEPWACLIGFICSTNKNIAAIEDMLRKMSERYGEKRCFDGKEFYLFPTAEVLAEVSERELLGCSLGYRARFVREAAQKIVEENIDLAALKAAPFLEARSKLLEFCGVGPKVRDCVLLFSLDKFEAFPVDVWVKRVILNHYADKFPAEAVRKMQSHNSLTNGEYQKNRRLRQRLLWQVRGLRTGIPVPF
jgi:N-glycosylase/DNA lyase